MLQVLNQPFQQKSGSHPLLVVFNFTVYVQGPC